MSSRKETKGKFRRGDIASFAIILTRTNAGVHKPLFQGYSYSLFKPRHTKEPYHLGELRARVPWRHSTWAKRPTGFACWSVRRSTLCFAFEPFHFGHRDHRIVEGRRPIPTKAEVGSSQMRRLRGRGAGERCSGRTWCWRALRACCGAPHSSRGAC